MAVLLFEQTPLLHLVGIHALGDFAGKEGAEDVEGDDFDAVRSAESRKETDDDHNEK